MTVLSKFVVNAILATAAPAVTDDNTNGYVPGKLWFNSTSGNLYWLKSNATGAAVWVNVTGGGGGGSVVGVTGDEVTIHVDNTDPTKPIITIHAGGVGTAQLAAGAVTTAKMDATGIAPGAYTSVNITVDAAGRITAIANGTGGGVASTDPGKAYRDLLAGMSGLISDIPMDEAPGATVAVDLVGGTNNLTRSGISEVAGMPGPILGTDYGAWKTAAGLRNAAPTSLPIGAAARTLICWVRTVIVGTSGYGLFGYGSTGVRNAFLLYMNGGFTGRISLAVYSDDLDVSDMAINDGQWHMIVGSYDGATGLKLYFDGRLIGTHTLGGVLSTAVNGDGLFVGATNVLSSTWQGFAANAAVFSRQLSDSEVLALWNAARLSAGQVTAGYKELVAAEASLVSYWKFDEAPSATTFVDSKSGNGLTGGTNYGQPSKSAIGVGSSISLVASANGAGSNSAMTGIPTGNAARTIEMLVRVFPGYAIDCGLLGYGSIGGGTFLALGMNTAVSGTTDGCFSAVFPSGLRIDASTSYRLNDGQWHHLVMTHDGTTVKLYVDGYLAASGAATLATAGGSVNVGGSFIYTTGLKGGIDEVAIYNTDLGAADILAHYKAFVASGGGGGAGSAKVITDWADEPITFSATTTAPTKGATIQRDHLRWRRVGDSIEIHMDYHQSSAGTAGTGTYLIALPTGAGAITIDATKTEFITSTSLFGAGCGSGFVSDETAFSRNFCASPYDTTHFKMTDFVVGDIGSANASIGTTKMCYSCSITLPITEWA